MRNINFLKVMQEQKALPSAIWTSKCGNNDLYSYTAITVKAKASCCDILNVLLEQIPLAQNPNISMAIKMAVATSNVSFLNRMMSEKLEATVWNAIDELGFNHLHYAAYRIFHPEIYPILWDKVDRHLKTPNNITYLHLAIIANNLSFLQFLQAKNALTATLCSAQDNQGNNVLHYAAQHLTNRTNIEDILQLLIEKGARLDARTIKNSTPFHVAAEKQNIAFLSYVLNNHITPTDWEHRNHMGQTFIDLIKNWPEICQKTLKKTITKQGIKKELEKKLSSSTTTPLEDKNMDATSTTSSVATTTLTSPSNPSNLLSSTPLKQTNHNEEKKAAKKTPVSSQSLQHQAPTPKTPHALAANTSTIKKDAANVPEQNQPVLKMPKNNPKSLPVTTTTNETKQSPQPNNKEYKKNRSQVHSSHSVQASSAIVSVFGELSPTLRAQHQEILDSLKRGMQNLKIKIILICTVLLLE